MATTCEAIKKYYEGWIERKGDIDKTIFTKDFKSTGPLKQFDKLNEFLHAIKEMAPGVTDINIKACFMNEENQAGVFVDFITEAPLKMTTPCAELFTLEDGKIKAIEVIYDARPWAGVL